MISEYEKPRLEVSTEIEPRYYVSEGLGELNPLFFPRSPEWYWYPAVKGNRSLTPRDTLEVVDTTGSGWLHSLVLKTTDPVATLRLTAYTGTQLPVDLSINDVYQLGFYGLGLGQFTVSRYDTTTGVYVLSYVPSGYGLPFRDRIKIEVFNPSTTDTFTVNRAETVLLMVG